jgi:hypothetical protein
MYKTMQINGHDVEVEYTIDKGQREIRDPVDNAQEGIEPSAEITEVWFESLEGATDVLPILSSEQVERLEEIALEGDDE